MTESKRMMVRLWNCEARGPRCTRETCGSACVVPGIDEEGTPVWICNNCDDTQERKVALAIDLKVKRAMNRTTKALDAVLEASCEHGFKSQPHQAATAKWRESTKRLLDLCKKIEAEDA